jgi:hypothetical protein
MKIRDTLLWLSVFLCGAAVVGVVMVAVRGSLPPQALPVLVVAGIVILLLIFSIGQSRD